MLLHKHMLALRTPRRMCTTVFDCQNSVVMSMQKLHVLGINATLCACTYILAHDTQFAFVTWKRNAIHNQNQSKVCLYITYVTFASCYSYKHVVSCSP